MAQTTVRSREEVVSQPNRSARASSVLTMFVTGTKRIKQLAENARYFRQGIKKLGFIVYGTVVSLVSGYVEC
jgi:7-keto-8-aminopelargonate synthetase-like enzyme